MIGACAALTFATAATVGAVAQDYPNRPITLIVPFPPGGSTSLISRIVGDKMSTILGQPVVMDNRGGAGGTVGTRAAAQAEADGYTIVFTFTGPIAVGPNLYPNAGYQPEDFTPIGRIGTTALAVAATPGVGINTLGELVDYVKAQPDPVQFGSAGIGSFGHLAGELFSFVVQAPMQHIPYDGNGAMMTDLLAGRIPVAFPNIPIAAAQVESGGLKLLAIAGPARSPVVPDVPTAAEAGLEGYNAVLTYGLLAPDGTPPEVIARLNAALNEALTDEAAAKLLADSDVPPVPGTPEDYAADIAKEYEEWGNLIREINLTIGG